MFAYCTEVLHLSDAEAYLRIAAARASREHPMLLEMLADGRLHLTAVAKLAPHLTLENREAVLMRAVYRSKREIEELVAELAPRPDAPALMRKLPERRAATPAAPSVSRSPNELAPGVGLRPDGVAADCQLPPGGAGAGDRQLRPDGVSRALRPTPSSVRTESACPAPSVERAATSRRSRQWSSPGPSRYRVQFTASAELHDKLERLRALMRSSVPDGDLSAIIEQAVTEKLGRLEARRFAQTKTSRKSLSTTDTTPRTRQIPAAVKRAVYERDGGRCRYVDEQGRRCTARGKLEFHHRHPFGHGGDHSVQNIARVGVHNRYLAEVDYGREAGIAARGSPSGVDAGSVAVSAPASARRRGRRGADGWSAVEAARGGRAQVQGQVRVIRGVA